tara:strand:- start:308 stop:784 length:477 start_codon:yes stop_codon:yes gene_type:complete
MTLKADLKQGKYNEIKVISYLNKFKYVLDKFIAYSFKYNRVDFSNADIIGELKSRNCNHDSYSDTMFGSGKLLYYLNNQNNKEFKVYFLFNDGLYVWDYTDISQNEFTIRPYYHTEKEVYELYCFVKKEYLQLITTDISTKKDIMNYKDKEDYFLIES